MLHRREAIRFIGNDLIAVNIVQVVKQKAVDAGSNCSEIS